MFNSNSFHLVLMYALVLLWLLACRKSCYIVASLLRIDSPLILSDFKLKIRSVIGLMNLSLLVGASPSLLNLQCPRFGLSVLNIANLILQFEL